MVTVWVLVIAITAREFIPPHATFLAFLAVIPMAILVTPIPMAIPPVANIPVDIPDIPVDIPDIPVDIPGSLVTVDDITRCRFSIGCSSDGDPGSPIKNRAAAPFFYWPQ